MSACKAFSRLALAAAVVMACSGPSAAEELDGLMAALGNFGVPLARTKPFDDAPFRALCGFQPSVGQKIYLQAPGAIISGTLAADGLTATSVVLKPLDDPAPLCFPEVAVSNLSLTEGAVSSGDLSLRLATAAAHPEAIEISLSLHVRYDPATQASELGLEGRVVRNGEEMGSGIVSAALTGIDLVKWQQPSQRQGAPTPMEVARAGFQSFSLSYMDHGLIKRALEEQSKTSGRSTHALLADARAGLQNLRNTADPTGSTAITTALNMVEATLVNGGGLKVLVAPGRDVKFIEFVDEGKRTQLIGEMNISAEHVAGTR